MCPNQDMRKEFLTEELALAAFTLSFPAISR